MAKHETLERITSTKELRIGMGVRVGYPGLKKTTIEIRRWDTQEERDDYKRYWLWCIEQGIVFFCHE